MDPSVTLAKIRELTEKANLYGELNDNKTQDLVDLVESLDDWMSKGGFLPEPWEIGRAK